MAVGEPMEGGVEVRPGVRHHVDAPDLELVALGVPVTRCFPAEVIADHRSRQPGVGDRAITDRMTEVDDRRHELNGTDVIDLLGKM